MQNRKIERTKFIPEIMILFFISVTFLSTYAQHRGDNLAFQGIDLINTSSVKALAMGGAYTSVYGELGAIFWNPAGLVGLSGPQISVDVDFYKKLWRERQDYRPNRQVVTMSFILDGLYTPNPEYNGWYDYKAFLQDSNYIVAEPVLGKDPYSKESADWQKVINKSGLNNIALAIPFMIMKKPAVISASYSQQLPVMNYDRNDTYLDPHLTSSLYGPMPERVIGPSDSVRINWSTFERLREGPLQRISTAFALGVTEYIKLGLGFSRLLGETTDSQSLKKVGYFDLLGDYNKFKFSYDTRDLVISGTSNFSGNIIEIGTIFNFNHISIGAKIVPSYTIKRKWDYTTIITNKDSSTSQSFSGIDKMKIPMSYSVGLSLKPRESFVIATDLEKRRYSDAEISLAVFPAGCDTVHTNWFDQTIFRFGIEYKPVSWLSILAGYRKVPTVFIPDGAAIKDSGPPEESYTIGLSINAPKGRFDIVYEIRTLKYYEQYYSNTNYVLERCNNLMFGYTIIL